MAPTIRIDDEVYFWLQGKARPFEDTPNSVLRRLAGLDEAQVVRENRTTEKTTRKERGTKTPQTAFRMPILQLLAKHGGKATRTLVLEELEAMMEKELTSFDREAIESGTVRWQKSAEWEVRVMREAKLLKPVDEAPRGVWALTTKGEDAAQETG